MLLIQGRAITKNDKKERNMRKIPIIHRGVCYFILSSMSDNICGRQILDRRLEVESKSTFIKEKF